MRILLTTATTVSAAIIPTTNRWVFPDSADTTNIAILSEELRIPFAAAQLLWRRGYRDGASAEYFLNPRLQDMHDPFLLRDMDIAVERILRAVAAQESIEIHGDYDVDGVTSTVVLKTALQLIGLEAAWHIPHRLQDGYGMQPVAVDGAHARGVRLLISVDNGIRAEAAITRAAELGIDVIVTDHHLPETQMPPALAIINPSRTDCSYPNSNLCGAGVALKLAHALLLRAGWPEAKLFRTLESFLKLVAIATVADIVPLTGENRVIVKYGLKGLDDIRNPGLRALLEVAGFKGKVPNATEVAFRIAPAINASGRMDSAGLAVKMFLTKDAAEAESIARELFAHNQERQTAERAIVHEIFERCVSTPVTDMDAALVFCGEGWHRGVVGIVASRVMQRFHRPAVVMGIENGVAQGSARGVEEFHLLDALESMRELLTKFGGHAHAAGLTLPADSVDVFRERLRLYTAQRLTPEQMRPVVKVDAMLNLPDVDERLWLALEQIAPFGMDNPRPVFGLRGARLSGPAQLWKDKHLKMAVKQGGRTVVLKGFGMGERAPELPDGCMVDVAFEIERDWFGGLGLLARNFRGVEPANA